MEDLLAQILEQLKQNSSPKSILGFTDPPKVRYIYANRKYPDCLWYFWNGAENVHEPIEKHAIVGIVEKIDVEEAEYKGKTNLKVNFHVRADRPYVIQSGLDTLFAKGLLHTLSKISVEAFKKPIMISAEAGEDDKVLFSRVYNPATGILKFAPYDDSVCWPDVLAKAIDRVAQAQSQMTAKN